MEPYSRKTGNVGSTGLHSFVSPMLIPVVRVSVGERVEIMMILKNLVDCDSIDDYPESTLGREG